MRLFPILLLFDVPCFSGSGDVRLQAVAIYDVGVLSWAVGASGHVRRGNELN